MARLKQRTRIGADGWPLALVFWLAAGLMLAPGQAAAQLGGTSPTTAIGEVVQRILVIFSWLLTLLMIIVVLAALAYMVVTGRYRR